jgi:hypothetical protein
MPVSFWCLYIRYDPISHETPINAPLFDLPEEIEDWRARLLTDLMTDDRYLESEIKDVALTEWGLRDRHDFEIDRNWTGDYYEAGQNPVFVARKSVLCS